MNETEEINARFDAMIARAKLSSDLRDEEIVVRQLAWKRDTDALLHEREASTEAHRMAIEAHRSVIVANTELAEQARVMIATRHAEMAKLDEHRRNIEAIYREGFEGIANALKALTTPMILNESGPGTCPHGKSGSETCDACSFTWRDAPIGAGRCASLHEYESLTALHGGPLTRCTRHAGHAGSHCADELEWS
jgi:hypothetical protein